MTVSISRAFPVSVRVLLPPTGQQLLPQAFCISRTHGLGPPPMASNAMSGTHLIPYLVICSHCLPVATRTLLVLESGCPKSSCFPWPPLGTLTPIMSQNPVVQVQKSLIYLLSLEDRC